MLRAAFLLRVTLELVGSAANQVGCGEALAIEISRKLAQYARNHDKTTGKNRRACLHRARAREQKTREVQAASCAVGADQREFRTECLAALREPATGQRQRPGTAKGRAGAEH